MENQIKQNKMIERMATIMCGRNIDCEKCECRKGFCHDLSGASKLVNYYQPKIPDGAVVLTKEEYEEYQDLLKNFDNYLFEYRKFADGCIKDSRKETAAKIFDELYTWLDLEEIEKYGFVHIQKFDFLRKFREINTKIVGVQQGEKDED